jgi:hypothetical protein
MNDQLDLLSYRPPLPNIHFHGATISIPFDLERLNAQMQRVHGLMVDGKWRSLREISDATGDPEASVSARLRDYRSNEYLAQFFTMISERVPGFERRGYWRYRVQMRGP